MDEELKCCECGKPLPEPGTYEAWSDDEDNEFVLCNPCSRAYSEELRETAKIEDIRYP